MKIHYIHKTFLFHGKIASYETKKRSARMRARAKQKHVASDRARCPNVPRHILYIFLREKEIQKNTGFFHEAENGNFVFRTD